MTLGDFFAKEFEKYNRYWDIVKGGGANVEDRIYSPLTAPVMKPPVSPDPMKIPPDPKDISISQKDWMMYKSFQEYLLAKLLYMAEEMKRNRYAVKSPNWVEPPLNARPIDVFNSGWVNVAPAGMPVPQPPTELELLKIVVPVGHIAIINRISNIADPIGAYDELYWTIQIDEKTLQSSVEWYYMNTAIPPVQTKGEQYKDFQIQLGDVTNPTSLTMPFILKERQTFSLIVKSYSCLSVYKVKSRIMGYIFAPAQGGIFAPEFAMQG